MPSAELLGGTSAKSRQSRRRQRCPCEGIGITCSPTAKAFRCCKYVRWVILAHSSRPTMGFLGSSTPASIDSAASIGIQSRFISGPGRRVLRLRRWNAQYGYAPDSAAFRYSTAARSTFVSSLNIPSALLQPMHNKPRGKPLSS